MILDLTVIIPYYNESETIIKTLNQISIQTFKPKNVILVNSSSTDNTSNIIDEWINGNNDELIKYINLYKETKLPSSSKNVGLDNTNTEYIAFMDCELEFGKCWIENQYNRLIKYQKDIVFGSVQLSGMNIIDKCAVAHTYGYYSIKECIPGSILKKSLFHKIGKFKEHRSGYDVLWRNKLKKVNNNFHTPYEPIVHYMNINYSDSYTHLFRKTFMYTYTSEEAFMNSKNSLLLLLFLIIIVMLFFSPLFSIFTTSAYFTFRSFILPVIKSHIIKSEMAKVDFLYNLIITAIIIDMGKALGTIRNL